MAGVRGRAREPSDPARHALGGPGGISLAGGSARVAETKAQPHRTPEGRAVPGKANHELARAPAGGGIDSGNPARLSHLDRGANDSRGKTGLETGTQRRPADAHGMERW